MTPTSDKFGSGVAGLAPLASDRQCYPCKLGVSGSLSFVVTDMLPMKKSSRNRSSVIGVPVEQGQFIFRVSDDLFLVVTGIFLFLYKASSSPDRYQWKAKLSVERSRTSTFKSYRADTKEYCATFLRKTLFKGPWALSVKKETLSLTGCSFCRKRRAIQVSHHLRHAAATAG
jgi:hypothetical protein